MQNNVAGVALAALLGVFHAMTGCARGSEGPGSVAGSAAGEGAVAVGDGGAGGSGTAPECVAESCDGADNDCDGVVDEGCECFPGETEICYSGPPGTDGVGACRSGTRECDAATMTFGPCVGEVVPASQETCDGQDDDCDGLPDDGLADLHCGVGACGVTAPACLGGQPGTCVPGMPSQELCDGVDNDCDQLVDEAFPGLGWACDTGLLGACEVGSIACVDGATTCRVSHPAEDELCDGVDNDCDGSIDEEIAGLGGGCSTGAAGVCGPGKVGCQGATVDCYPLVPASAEVCDGLDNDCDGAVDNGDPGGGGACDTGALGACGEGVLVCAAGALSCQPVGSAEVEVCDGTDNDCDGQIDEGNPGSGQPCSCGGQTACVDGAPSCQGCTREVVCNDGLDDDGDGLADCEDTDCALGCNPNVGPCAAGQKMMVLRSLDVPKVISDGSTASSTLMFSEAAVVRRVVVRLFITHSWVSDLELRLKAPSAAPVLLSSDNGSSGDDYAGTIFDDGCVTLVSSAQAPFNGCYAPESALGALNGGSLTGTWTLEVLDDAAGDVGTLTGWTLAICVQ